MSIAKQTLYFHFILGINISVFVGELCWACMYFRMYRLQYHTYKCLNNNTGMVREEPGIQLMCLSGSGPGSGSGFGFHSVVRPGWLRLPRRGDGRGFFGMGFTLAAGFWLLRRGLGLRLRSA